VAPPPPQRPSGPPSGLFAPSPSAPSPPPRAAIGPAGLLRAVGGAPSRLISAPPPMFPTRSEPSHPAGPVRWTPVPTRSVLVAVRLFNPVPDNSATVVRPSPVPPLGFFTVMIIPDQAESVAP